MNEEEQIKNILEIGKKLKENYYTGFTTRCKKCNKDIRSIYVGKNEKGVPSYLLKCGCK